MRSDDVYVDVDVTIKTYENISDCNESKNTCSHVLHMGTQTSVVGKSQECPRTSSSLSEFSMNPGEWWEFRNVLAYKEVFWARGMRTSQS